MIEFTFIEAVLFVWGVAATAFAFKFHHEALMAKFFLRKVITDETVRNDLVESYQKFERSTRA